MGMRDISLNFHAWKGYSLFPKEFHLAVSAAVFQGSPNALEKYSGDFYKVEGSPEIDRLTGGLVAPGIDL